MSVPLCTFSFADQTTNGLVGNPARCLEVASNLPARARMIFLFENVAADSRSDSLASEHHGLCLALKGSWFRIHLVYIRLAEETRASHQLR